MYLEVFNHEEMFHVHFKTLNGNKKTRDSDCPQLYTNMEPAFNVCESKAARKQVPLMQLQVKMPQNSSNNGFRRKQTTNKVPANIFRCFKLRTSAQLMFRTPNHSMKVN